MDKTNLELFKQALEEAISNRFDKMVEECSEEIIFSERHLRAMHTIIYGSINQEEELREPEETLSKRGDG